MVVNKGKQDEDFVVTGNYWIKKESDGSRDDANYEFIRTKFTADKNGYHAHYSIISENHGPALPKISPGAIKSLVGR